MKYKGIPLFILLPIVSMAAFFLLISEFLAISTYGSRKLPVMEGQFFEDDTIIITQDFGGRIADKVSHILWLNHQKYDVAIEGICASSCTLYLGVENVCVSRDASLMIHPAHLEPNVPYVSGIILSSVSSIWRMMIPHDLANWMEGATATMGPEEVYWFLGDDLIAAGWAKECAPATHQDLAQRRRILAEIPFQHVPKNPMPARGP